MKALIYRYGSICEPDIISSFEEFGLEVKTIDWEVTDKTLSGADVVPKLSEYLMDYPVDMVFSINFFTYVSDVCNILKIPYLSWIVDAPVMELFSHSVSHPYNKIFVFDKATFDEIEKYNPDNIFHLPLAANVSEKQQVIANASASQISRFSADISFVGSLYTEKDPYANFNKKNEWLAGYLDALSLAQSKVYGYYFVPECLTDDVIKSFKDDCHGFYHRDYKSYLDDKYTLANFYLGNHISALERTEIFNRLSNRFDVDIYTASDVSAMTSIHNKGLAKTLTEMPIIFANSVINLNPTSKGIRTGIPLRCFDIMACGGFMLSNYQSELFDYFIAGEDFDFYDSMDSLEEKCHFYLNRPEIAKEIGMNALEKIKAEHTYIVRICQMFKLAFGI